MPLNDLIFCQFSRDRVEAGDAEQFLEQVSVFAVMFFEGLPSRRSFFPRRLRKRSIGQCFTG
jgi:hypothetical protein